jgi:hypothetical protein
MIVLINYLTCASYGSRINGDISISATGHTTLNGSIAIDTTDMWHPGFNVCLHHCSPARQGTFKDGVTVGSMVAAKDGVRTAQLTFIRFTAFAISYRLSDSEGGNAETTALDKR